MTFETLKDQVQSGSYIHDDATAEIQKTDAPPIVRYLDFLNYRVAARVRQWLSTSFRNDLNGLSIDQKAELATLDAKGIISAILISDLLESDFKALAGSNQAPIPDMLNAIAIYLEDLDFIDKRDQLLLYLYFVNARVSEETAPTFASEDFIRLLLDKLLNEERVIFTSIIKNLILMVDRGHIDVTQHREFFQGLFYKNNYIQGELAELLLRATKKDNGLFDLISSTQLSIDPFTKQIDYSRWLRDGKKFLYLEILRNNIPHHSSPQIAKFEARVSKFKEINKFDRSFTFY
jgi:hypothetical protein